MTKKGSNTKMRRDRGGGDGRGVNVNGGHVHGGGSNCLQSFRESHRTHPPSKRSPIYTTEQKDEAVRLLDEGAPVKVIAERLGSTCSKSSIYRWRPAAHERKRKREAKAAEEANRELPAEVDQREGESQAEAARLEEERRRRHVRREWIWTQLAQLTGFIHENHDVFLFLLCALGEVIAYTLFMGIVLQVIWIFWRLAVLLHAPGLGLELVVRIYTVSVAILWTYLICSFGAYLLGAAREMYRFVTRTKFW